jgi:ribosome assembly protein 1
MHHASHAVLEAHPRRLMEAFFRAELQCVGEVLGRLVGVVNQRRGRVVSHDDMVEGTAFFNVKALLPVQASFGFVSAVRASTSGITNPVLYLSHWDVLPVDPYFVPKTELELEECGTQDLSHNLAKELVSDVRRRKGLLVDDVVVAAPEKQRTISRKK